MKHIFWAHSHITYLVSLLVIKYLDIPVNDIVFITYRGYKLPKEKIKGEFLVFFEVKTLNSQKLISFKHKFELYVPHTKIDGFEEGVKLNNCVNYNIIEEGVLAYIHYDNPIKVIYQKITKFIGVKRSLRMLDYAHSKFKSVYCVDDKAFRGVSKNNKVVLPFLFDNNINVNPINTKCGIIVFDGLVYYEIITLEKLLELLAILILSIQKTNQDKIFYKFHPDQLLEGNEKEIIEIQKKFSKVNEIEFIELPQEVILEEILFTNNKVTIYNFVSSIGFYASLTGNKVYSLSDRIKRSRLTNLIKEKWQQI